MVADGLAGHCTGNVGVSISVGALLSSLVLRLVKHYVFLLYQVGSFPRREPPSCEDPREPTINDKHSFFLF